MKLIAQKEFRENILGVSISTFWRWHNSGALPPSVVIGSRRFWRSEDVDAWLEEKKESVKPEEK